VFPATQGDSSWIPWSLSQECQHVLSSDIRQALQQELLDTSPALQQEVALPANFMFCRLQYVFNVSNRLDRIGSV
jgi:hypothetical protein